MIITLKESQGPVGQNQNFLIHVIGVAKGKKERMVMKQYLKK